MLSLNFSPFPVLNSERLILRQLEPGDTPEIFILRSDEGVNEFIDRPRASSPEDALKFITKINTGILANESIFWAITLKTDPRLSGTVCLWNISRENHRAEIGYELLPRFQRQGIMHEAIPVVIEFGFEQMKLHCIEAVLHADNYRSARVLEKNNFKRDLLIEKNIDKELHDKNMVVYTLTSSLRPVE